MAVREELDVTVGDEDSEVLGVGDGVPEGEGEMQLTRVMRPTAPAVVGATPVLLTTLTSATGKAVLTKLDPPPPPLP